MHTMHIIIRGVSVTPKWNTLQKIVRQMTEREGRFTRIKRIDGGCNYRAPGAYVIDFVPTIGDAIAVNLLVTEEI